MQNESVWFEQVDTALLEYIKSKVLLKADNVLTSVKVLVRMPDPDFKIETFPCITIYNLYSKRDNLRYYPDKVTVKIDPSTHYLIEENAAIPYNLFYQVDFWSDSQTVMNDMTLQWLSKHPDRLFNLDVVDMSGNTRSCPVLLTDDLRKFDEFSEGERIFHSTLTYKISVELDNREQFSTPMITSIPAVDTNKE